MLSSKFLSTRFPILRRCSSFKTVCDISEFDAFLFDCDGVIWKGEHMITGADRAIKALQSQGKLTFFVTNNSTKSREVIMKKLHSMNINCRVDNVYSSAYAAAVYLKNKNFPQNGKSVFVVGMDGIGHELDRFGIKHMSKVNGNMMKNGVHVDHDSNVGAVVVGFDCNINYDKINYAQLCLNNNEGCLFLATNTDATAHFVKTQSWAAGGAMVGAVAGCCPLVPKVVVGKPSAYLIDDIVEEHNLSKIRTCMVGDRLDTDILFGHSHGLKTCLVMSGVTSKEVLERSISSSGDGNNNQSPPRIVPDHVIDSIDSLA